MIRSGLIWQHPRRRKIGRHRRSDGSAAGRHHRTESGAQTNAQLAGRPRRICTTCGEPVVGGHVDRRLDLTCGAHGWRWQQKHHPPTVEALHAQIEAHQRAIASLQQQLAAATC
jgi:hypothetical protein